MKARGSRCSVVPGGGRHGSRREVWEEVGGGAASCGKGV